MDNAQFRVDFPEFANPEQYPDSQLNFWGGIATKMVNACLWLDMTTTGIELYVAHELTLARLNAQAAQSGGTPGQSGGIASSKTVGQVSVSYDPNTTTEKDAGWWNLTVYGKQFIRLARMFGAGVVQL